MKNKNLVFILLILLVTMALSSVYIYVIDDSNHMSINNFKLPNYVYEYMTVQDMVDQAIEDGTWKDIYISEKVYDRNYPIKRIGEVN